MRPTRSSAPSMRSRPRTEAWASTSRKIIPRLASSVWSSRKSWRPLDRPSAKLRDRKIFYSIGELGVSSRVRPLKKYRAEKALPNLEGLADHETKTTIRRPSMRITFRQSGFGRDVGTAPEGRITWLRRLSAALCLGPHPGKVRGPESQRPYRFGMKRYCSRSKTKALQI